MKESLLFNSLLLPRYAGVVASYIGEDYLFSHKPLPNPPHFSPSHIIDNNFLQEPIETLFGMIEAMGERGGGTVKEVEVMYILIVLLSKSNSCQEMSSYLLPLIQIDPLLSLLPPISYKSDRQEEVGEEDERKEGGVNPSHLVYELHKDVFGHVIQFLWKMSLSPSSHPLLLQSGIMKTLTSHLNDHASEYIMRLSIQMERKESKKEEEEEDEEEKMDGRIKDQELLLLSSSLRILVWIKGIFNSSWIYS